MTLLKLALVAAASLCASAAVAATSIEVSTSQRKLFLNEDGVITEFPIAVGTREEQWRGTEVVSRKAEWPAWRPTADTRRKHPKLPQIVPGGPKNPLGARALYLGSSVYRIHGTNQPKSIGKAASGGCFRMRNADVIELYQRVPVGTVVTVR